MLSGRMRGRNLIPLLGLLLLLSGCGQPPPAAVPAGAQAPVPPPEPIVITGAGFDLHTAGRVSPATFDATWAGVLDTLNRYMEAGVLAPLRSGAAAGDLAPFFTPLAVDRVAGGGPDRAAFVDEGLAPATDLRKERAVATLTALAGADGTISVVVANLDLRLTGLVGGGPFSLDRAGELVLMPEGETWRIDAWNLKVTRRLTDTTTTTTAAAP